MSEEAKVPTARIVAARAEWEPEDNSDSDKHVLAVGPFDAIAFGHCRCGCNAGPGWSIEFYESVEGDFAARSLEDAQQRAESEIRKAYEALAAHYAPVLRWEMFRLRSSQEHVATFNRYRLEAGENGCWELLVLSKSGAVMWCADNGRAADGPSARLAAENALRDLGVVFRVEEGK